jgi:hypothetical protein
MYFNEGNEIGRTILRGDLTLVDLAPLSRARGERLLVLHETLKRLNMDEEFGFARGHQSTITEQVIAGCRGTVG